MSEENKWIPVGERLPDAMKVVDAANDRMQITWAAFLSNGHWVQDSENPVGRRLLRVTHWKERCQPPPKPDAFEEFFDKMHGVVCCSKRDAKEFWDAAVASVKGQS